MTCSYDSAPNLGVAAHRRADRRECPGRLEAIPRTVGTSTPGVGPQVDQADLDSWIAEYNEARPHQGRWCFGKTPMQTFLDATPIAKEKMIAA